MVVQLLKKLIAVKHSLSVQIAFRGLHSHIGNAAYILYTVVTKTDQLII